MKFDVLTLFPKLIESVTAESIIGRAIENGIISVNAINIRDYSKNKHKKVDDYPYGGGSGMVMSAEPICDAYFDLVKKLDYKPHCIFLSPQGKTFTQETAKRLKCCNHLVLICGHYEGVDERVIEQIVDEEISIGDFVLTGGELPALMIIDSVARLVPNVLGAQDGFLEESFYNGLLEYPQYTRPENYNEKIVPEMLTSGHHENIRIWRKKESLRRTFNKRLDLFIKYEFNEEDIKILINDIPEAIDSLIENRPDLINLIKSVKHSIIKKNAKIQKKKQNT